MCASTFHVLARGTTPMVLLADSHAPTREILRRMLVQRGCAVTAIEAFPALSAALGSTDARYDWVLAELCWPATRVDQVIAQLTLARAPITVMSARPPLEATARLGATLLEKPFAVDAFDRCFADALAPSSRERP